MSVGNTQLQQKHKYLAIDQPCSLPLHHYPTLTPHPYAHPYP